MNYPREYRQALKITRRGLTREAFGDVGSKKYLISNFLAVMKHNNHGDNCRTCLDIAEDIIAIVKERLQGR